MEAGVATERWPTRDEEVAEVAQAGTAGGGYIKQDYVDAAEDFWQ